MAELKTISAALKLIDAKKESLRKAFEDLEAHSSSLSSFTLTWSAIDAHFSSIQSSLSRQFEILESRTDSVPQNDTLPTNNAVSLPAQSNAVSLPPQNNAVSLPPQNNAVSLPPQESAISRPTQNSAVSRPPQNNANPSHPQLRLLCSAMDAEALRRYIMDHPNDRETLRSELLDAFQVARDPAKMVLDALTGFFPSNANEDGSSELHTMRRSCVFMLEQLMLFSPQIGEDVRQRAKSLAQEWKGKVKVGDNTLKPMGFLHLLAAYGLGSDYDSTELLELLIDVVRYREVFGLCRGLNLVDKVPDLIQNLIGSGKPNLAVKFVLEFKLTHKFPLIAILKDIVESSRDVARKVRKDGKHSLQSVNEATSKEISALKLVTKYIKDYDLNNEYPGAPLEERIQKLESQMAARTAAKKRPALAPAPRPKQQKKQKSKQAQTTATASPSVPSGAAGTSSTAAPFQQPHLQAPGLVPDGPVPFMNPSAGLYGFAGVPMGFPGNLGPPMPHLHPMEPQLPMPFAHGGYGLQSLYPPAYFHQ